MEIPTLNDLKKIRSLMPGLVFLFVNASASYMFFHVNSYKLFLLLTGLSILAVLIDIFLFNKNTSNSGLWEVWAVLSVPLIATIPGYFFHHGNYNYNFQYELAINLAVISWAVYLFRIIKNIHDLRQFFFLTGITVLFVSIFAFMERAGLNPLNWAASSVVRVKSTFGNSNYFSGFLIILLPLFFIFSLPFDNISEDRGKRKLSKHNIFYMTVFSLGFMSLILAQTRSAIAACLAAHLFIIILYTIFFISKELRLKIIKGIILFLLLLVAAGVILFFSSSQEADSRFLSLFSIDAWLNRFMPWRAAIESIKSSPVIGFGLGSSYNLFFQFVDPAARLLVGEHSYNHAHSEFLEYFQESGVVGLILLSVFWGYIIVKIGKTLKSSSNSDVKKILIGVSGGLLAYSIHSFFSVAPRMVVTKLPLFTLFGLVFIVKKQNFNAVEEGFSDFKDKLLSVLPSLVAVLIIWYIYAPWASKQYMFNRIRSIRPSLTMIKDFEKLMKTNPDIYALDYLTNLQVKFKRVNELEETVDMIEKLIPNYRGVRFTRAIAAYYKNDYETAKKLALAYQSRDLFQQQVIRFLTKLAIATDDKSLFEKQLKLFVHLSAVKNKLIHSKNAKYVKVHIKEIDAPIIIDGSSGLLKIDMSINQVNSFYSTARLNLEKGNTDPGEKKKFINGIIQVFFNNRYFMINFKPGISFNEKNRINNSMRAYFSIKKEWNNRKNNLKKIHKLQLIKSGPGNRSQLKKKQALEIIQEFKPYDEKMKYLSKYLLERTDWEMFNNKLKFRNEFINEISFHLFPKIVR